MLAMHKRVERRINLFIDNMIINPQFIGSQQTHRKRRLDQIDLHEHRGEHCIEDQRERISHIDSIYGPLGPWKTTHTSSKGQQGWCRGPL